MKFNFFKIVISLAVFTYVFSTVGVCIIAHYCGGELEKVSLFAKSSSCCGGEEDEMEDGCCKNETKHMVFQKDFTFYTLITICKAFTHDLFTCTNMITENKLESYFFYSKKTHPPNLVQQDIVLNSVLRI